MRLLHVERDLEADTSQIVGNFFPQSCPRTSICTPFFLYALWYTHTHTHTHTYTNKQHAHPPCSDISFTTWLAFSRGYTQHDCNYNTLSFRDQRV